MGKERCPQDGFAREIRLLEFAYANHMQTTPVISPEEAGGICSCPGAPQPGRYLSCPCGPCR